jgi:protocatechuate 3,4-dioxygenase beta subunit
MSRDEYARRSAGGIWTRRELLRAAAGGALWVTAPLQLLGCGAGRDAPDASAPPSLGGGDPALAPTAGARSPALEPGRDPRSLECSPTHDNIEGPYYRPGTPERDHLATPGMKGTPLIVRGRVTAADCAEGLGGAVLDVWQADADGHYDNDGSMPLAPDRYLLRGTLRSDASGAYAFRTIVPGRYMNGAAYRPAHIHVKLRAAGHRPLTTQLYFPDDPYNQRDPFIHRSLIMAVERGDGGQSARFDFALAPLS